MNETAHKKTLKIKEIAKNIIRKNKKRVNRKKVLKYNMIDNDLTNMKCQKPKYT